MVEAFIYLIFLMEKGFSEVIFLIGEGFSNLFELNEVLLVWGEGRLLYQEKENAVRAIYHR